MNDTDTRENLYLLCRVYKENTQLSTSVPGLWPGFSKTEYIEDRYMKKKWNKINVVAKKNGAIWVSFEYALTLITRVSYDEEVLCFL